MSAHIPEILRQEAALPLCPGCLSRCCEHGVCARCQGDCLECALPELTARADAEGDA